MTSLHAHIVGGEAHASLPFHRSCPACRHERLEGAFGPEAIVSRSTRAVMCVLTLGLSGTVATAASLVNPGPAQAGNCDSGGNADTDADEEGEDDGGSSDDCDEGSAAEETVPLDQTPATDAIAPEDGGQVPQPGAPAPPTPPAAAPAPAAPTTPAAPAPPAAAPPEAAVPPPPAPVAPSATPAVPEVEVTDGDAADGAQRERQPRRTADRAPEHHEATPPASVPIPSPEAPAPAREQPPPAGSPTGGPAVPAASAQPPSPVAVQRAKVYEVQAGDSLWSIAVARLGSDAGAAQVAHYVQRLWDLNADRITSGDPGLIQAGQSLRLPR